MVTDDNSGKEADGIENILALVGNTSYLCRELKRVTSFVILKPAKFILDYLLYYFFCSYLTPLVVSVVTYP